MIMSEEGVVIRVKAVDISKLGRSTQGVKVMNIGADDHVSAIARMIVHKKKALKHAENQGMLDLQQQEQETPTKPRSLTLVMRKSSMSPD